MINQLGVDDGTKVVALPHGDGLFNQFLVFTDQLIRGFRQRAIAPRFFGGIPSVPVDLQADATKFPEGGWDVARVAFVVELQGALIAVGVVVVRIIAGLTVTRLTFCLIGQPNMARGIDQTSRIELFGQESHFPRLELGPTFIENNPTDDAGVIIPLDHHISEGIAQDLFVLF